MGMIEMLETMKIYWEAGSIRRLVRIRYRHCYKMVFTTALNLKGLVVQLNLSRTEATWNIPTLT